MDKLWVFGASNCLPYKIKDENLGWANLLANKLNLQLNMHANDASDNMLIYHCYCENQHRISQKDIVIIGWTHPDRKTFVYNDENAKQQEIKDSSIFYTMQTQSFIRSKNSVDNSILKYTNSMKPSQAKGTQYYDIWFRDYHNEYEQRLHLTAYMQSVLFTSPCQTVFFYFSKESVKNIVTYNNAGYMLDFVLDNRCAISKNDAHLNEQGHRIWANDLYSFLNE